MRYLIQTDRTLPSTYPQAAVWLLTSHRVRFPPLPMALLSWTLHSLVPKSVSFLLGDSGLCSSSAWMVVPARLQSACLSLRQDPSSHPQLPGPCVKLMYPFTCCPPLCQPSGHPVPCIGILRICHNRNGSRPFVYVSPTLLLPLGDCDHLSPWALRLLWAPSSRTLGRCPEQVHLWGVTAVWGTAVNLMGYEGYPLPLSETEVQVGTICCDCAIRLLSDGMLVFMGRAARIPRQWCWGR